MIPMIKLVTFLGIFQFQLPAGPPIADILQARLRCERESVPASEPLICWVTLEVEGRFRRTIVVPDLLTPGRIPRRPPTVIEFELESPTGPKRTLVIAPPAQRGRYDLAGLRTEDLVVLMPGRSIGFEYDLNGQDWLLPGEPGLYSVRAVITVGLLERDASGDLSAAVTEKLGKWVADADKLVMNGTWRSNWTTIRIESP
jgi:hypothetical protein